MYWANSVGKSTSKQIWVMITHDTDFTLTDGETRSWATAKRGKVKKHSKIKAKPVKKETTKSKHNLKHQRMISKEAAILSARAEKEYYLRLKPNATLKEENHR